MQVPGGTLPSYARDISPKVPQLLDNLTAIWDWQLAGLLGLLVGSFLNVVIHRLPLMLEQRWTRECAELNGQEALPEATLGLAQPRSHCPSCSAPIRWYQNIPLLSFALLRGRCASCQAPISWRYPLVEALTGILFAWVVARHGNGMAGLVGCGLAAALVALAWIDWDTTLLPDDITLPLVWAGLSLAVVQLVVPRAVCLTLPEAVTEAEAEAALLPHLGDDEDAPPQQAGELWQDAKAYWYGLAPTH